MPTLFLKVFFICFLGFVSLQMLSNYRPPASREMPGALGTAGVGGVIGLISSFVGIGGGTLSVPFMSFCNAHHHAVSTGRHPRLPPSPWPVRWVAISGGWSAPGYRPGRLVGFRHRCRQLHDAPIGAQVYLPGKLRRALPSSSSSWPCACWWACSRIIPGRTGTVTVSGPRVPAEAVVLFCGARRPWTERACPSLFQGWHAAFHRNHFESGDP